jgi:hypothetical protein
LDYAGISLEGLKGINIMTPRSSIIAIVWAPHEARTAMFANRLGATLHNIHYLKYKRPLVAPFKYVAQWLKTWLVLFQNRPHFVYITNPPIIAVLCIAMYCAVSRTRYIMDTHPPALYSRKWGWTLPLQRFLSRFAFMNVVDQDRFKALFESWGGRAIVLENPPKTAPEALSGSPDQNYFDITVINTFAVDEPLDIILEAAKCFPPTTRFFITGDISLAKSEVVKSAPSNVIFTGYLWREDFWNRLNVSRAIMVLTTYPYSLLGGGHDGMILRKPLILSDQPALTEYFTKGAVFVANTTEGIVSGVRAVQEKEAQLSLELAELSEEREQQWNAHFDELMSLIRTPELQTA